jgi:Flp pilus assembly pilin Flp
VKPVAALLADDSGQGLAEYALILALIATVCLVAVIVIGTNVQRLLTRAGSAL